MNDVIPRTKRGAEWKEFSEQVLTHIDTYAVSQYGDKGEDQIDDWSIEACQLAIIKYVKRFGKNFRPGQDKPDILKIAHYACFIYNKLEEENNAQKRSNRSSKNFTRTKRW